MISWGSTYSVAPDALESEDDAFDAQVRIRAHGQDEAPVALGPVFVTQHVRVTACERAQATLKLAPSVGHTFAGAPKLRRSSVRHGSVRVDRPLQFFEERIEPPIAVERMGEQWAPFELERGEASERFGLGEERNDRTELPRAEHAALGETRDDFVRVGNGGEGNDAVLARGFDRLGDELVFGTRLRSILERPEIDD